MPLKLTCPSCGQPTRVSEPYPLPGAEVQCTSCAVAMSVSYPPGVMDQLRSHGKRFAEDRPLANPSPKVAAAPRAPRPIQAPPAPSGQRPPVSEQRPPALEATPTSLGPAAPPRAGGYEPERTLSATRDPWGRLPGGAPEADASDPQPTEPLTRPEVRAEASRPRRPAAPPTMQGFLDGSSAPAAVLAAPAPQRAPDPTGPAAARRSESGATAAANADKPHPGPVLAPEVRPEPARRGPSPPSVPAFTLADPSQDTPDTPPRRTAGVAAPPPAPAPSSRSKAEPSAKVEPGGKLEPSAKAEPANKRRAANGGAKAKKAARQPQGQDRPRSTVGRWLGRLGCLAGVGAVVLAGGGAAAAGGGYWYYSQQLPSVEALQVYRPPTVTEVYDRDGELMGELYEQRRYVVPLDTIPDHVRNAFIAAEDEAFWNHGGVDYIGLVRAVLNEVTGGEKRQGASTITMQVTRNFLLTRDRTYERKIKEILLAQRIESVYDKQRILWLYLNELYLGLGAYGVEAASRVYFNKHASELTIAEAALIAGLAPAPSAYSPYKAYDKARVRQLYVLDQMAKNGFITQEQREAAKKEPLSFVNDENPFLTTAPHFTEHVRRHLMERYGFDRVYKDGLRVVTTMDLELQKVAQDAVKRQVRNVDRAVGYRRRGRESLSTDAAIAARRGEQEQKLKIDQAFAKDPAGRTPLAPKSSVVPGTTTEGVVLEVQKSWVRVGFGVHEGYVPIGWSEWVNEPNARFYRQRTQTDFTTAVQGWEEGVEKGGPLVRKGDVVLVEIVEVDAGQPVGPKAAEIPKVFSVVPGAGRGYAALELRQEPEVEAATMTYDLKTGAVRSMVGGANFDKSEFNRVTQAYRQVGSTFKPLVYAAAVDTEKITAASIVPDVKGASYTTDAGFVWKPDNYGDDYLGNITLRQALALSKNTCTIKVLESMDPGMNDDVLYKFARKLGIGGPPLHELSPEWVTRPDNDRLCPWVRETRESTICMDRHPPKDPNLTNTRHRALLKPDDVYMCRACDMSMGLGSASLTMEELMRAYSVFPTGGRLIQPYYIEEVRDRDGNVLEKHEAVEFPQVIRPEVATIGNWLLESVVNYGTGAPARVALGFRMGGKTGTTQDHKDVWFVGYTNDVLTASWVGYDEPRSLGAATTGGRTALPIFVDVMRVAAPKELDRPFPVWGDVEWAQIDEKKGTRVTSGGWNYPFIRGTAPASTGAAAGELTVDDFTEL